MFYMHVMNNDGEIKVIAHNEIANYCRDTFKVLNIYNIVY